MTTLETTYSMMKTLSEQDLQVIKTVVEALAKKDSGSAAKTMAEQVRQEQVAPEEASSDSLVRALYHPQTEDQLLERIDNSIAHIRQGKCRDARAISRELRERYSL